MDAELAMHCFEGSEKKMELLFVPSDGTDVSEMGWDQGLRTFRRAHWDKIVGLLNGCILKEDEQEHFDVYLISESSLFVYRDRIVILTCGTTTLLKTLQAILDSAEEVGLKTSYFQYSRKNFLFPEEQEFPHSSFDQEVDYMSQVFEDGRPHIFGPLSADHWVVFIADRIDRSGKVKEHVENEQTLNMYMYDIDPEVAQLFMRADPLIIPSILESNDEANQGGDDKNQIKVKDVEQDMNNMNMNSAFSSSAADATERSGISTLMTHGHVVHDHLFEPCGYSMNGCANGDAYWTIHITPEAHCSYASFETNYKEGGYAEIIKRVINVFKPKRFTTVEHLDCQSAAQKEEEVSAVNVNKYIVNNRVLNDFADKAYTIQMCNFVAE